MNDKRTAQEILADFRKELIGLEQQAKTAKQIEGAIWKLWGFVRESRDSLDSERCCRMIQDLVYGAVSAVNNRAAILAVELDAIREELRDSKKEVKRLTSELEKSCETVVQLESKITEAQDETDPPKSGDADLLPTLVAIAASDAIRNFKAYGKTMSEQDCYPSLYLRGDEWRYHRRVADNEWADDPDPVAAAKKAQKL